MTTPTAPPPLPRSGRAALRSVLLPTLALVLSAGAASPPSAPVAPPLRPGAAPLAPAGRRPPPTSASCRAEHAWRCQATGCEGADEGLQAEQFVLDLPSSTVGACLYTDCYAGKAQLSRDPDRPWVVTALAEVRSDRPAGGVPPPGSAPFPLTLTVDLRDGRFTATWAHAPDGLQADFGTCRLTGP